MAAFVQDLLCYDTVVLLTDQMAALGPLLELMGLATVMEAIEDGALKFVHDRQILSWPIRQGYKGVVPVAPINSLPPAGKSGGFSQAETSDLVAGLAIEMGALPGAAKRLGRAVERATIDFGGLPQKVDPSQHSLSAALVERVRTYRELVASSNDLGLREQDLARLQANLENPSRSPVRTKTWRVMRLRSSPGWGAIESGPALSRKQSSLLNLYVADRILGVVASIEVDAVLHTDDTVDRVYRTRLERIRRAAGAEFDEVLSLASVPMPWLNDPEGLDFSELLRARGSKAARSFRKVVAKRDLNPDQRLLQTYYRSLDAGLASRLEVRLVRFLTTATVDFALGSLPVLSAFDQFLTDNLLARTGPRFFIDHELPRALGAVRNDPEESSPN